MGATCWRLRVFLAQSWGLRVTVKKRAGVVELGQWAQHYIFIFFSVLASVGGIGPKCFFFIFLFWFAGLKLSP